MTKIAILLALGATTLPEVVGIKQNPSVFSDNLNEKINKLCVEIFKNQGNESFTKADIVQKIVEQFSVEELVIITTIFLEEKVKEAIRLMIKNNPLLAMLMSLEGKYN